eukprot:TRINITY_DN22530_c0_g1_i1.p1 TRINITY_DN22530_c0_g1~~TRINITY_DN22530_c0_g1_i1.p1  ORF type:complete len:302 (-),score=82.33 TRINITY_DN22530_c0_g1_i1:789-1694(-)
MGIADDGASTTKPETTDEIGVSDSFDDNPKQSWRDCLFSKKTVIRLAVAGVLIVGAAVGLLLLPEPITYYFQIAVEWIQGLGYWGPVAFVGIYALTNVLFIPGFVLNIAAGYVWNLWFGSLYVWFGAVFGAAASFFVGRYFFKEWSAFFVGRFEKVEVLSTVIGDNALKIIFLLRLSPVMPYNILNYTLSMIPKVKFWHYLLATSVGTTPGIIVFVQLGTVLKDLQAVFDGSAEETSDYQIIMIAGFAGTIVLMVIISWVAGRAIKKEMAKKRLARAASQGTQPTERTPLLGDVVVEQKVS